MSNGGGPGDGWVILYCSIALALLLLAIGAVGVQETTYSMEVDWQSYGFE